MAVQEQATRTNAINAKLDKTQAESECRFCDRVDETVRLSCECPMLAQREHIKGGMTGWVEKYFGKYVKKLVLM